MVAAPPDATLPPASRVKRGALLALGWLCVGLGAVGAVLPVMPSTVFLLIALWAFSRSSERLHGWLYHHPRYGPGLRAWEAHGVIAPRAKLLALALMASSFTLTLTLKVVPPPALYGLAVVLSAVAAYVVSRPSRPPGA